MRSKWCHDCHGKAYQPHSHALSQHQVALKKDGSVVWLDRGKGSWAMRSKSRDLVFYRDFFWNWNGKRIYSAKLLDNTCDLYLEGVIKGWAPFVQLGIYGYFQAVRR